MPDPISILATGSITYPGLALLTILVQPFAALAAGALMASGILQPWLTPALLFVVDMAMDTVWYVLGYVHGERVRTFLLRMLHLDESHAEHITARFRTHDARILLGAKLLGGAGIMPFILFTAGASRIPFRRYLGFCAIGEVFWTGVLIALGYFYATAISHIASLIDKLTFSLGIICVLAFAWYLIRHYFKID